MNKQQKDASHFSAGPQASEARLGKEDLSQSRRSSGSVTPQRVEASPFTTGKAGSRGAVVLRENICVWSNRYIPA